MKFIKILSYPFVPWDKPIWLTFFSTVLLLICMPLNVEFMSAISGLAFLIILFLLILSFIILLFKRQWRKSFYTMLFILAVAMIIGLLN